MPFDFQPLWDWFRVLYETTGIKLNLISFSWATKSGAFDYAWHTSDFAIKKPILLFFATHSGVALTFYGIAKNFTHRASVRIKFRLDPGRHFRQSKAL